jgi:uncharacterized lipoprotein
MQIEKIIICFFVLLSCISLTACGSMLRHKDYYAHDGSVKPIVVPAGLSSSTIKDDYPVPPVNTAAPTQQPSDLLPPGVIAKH